MQLNEKIRALNDYPVEGVVFRDITTLLKEPEGFKEAVDALAKLSDVEVDVVIGIEARGFIVGAPLAYLKGAGFVPVRKPGKLPAETLSREYALEYGTDCLEIHKDAILPGQKVLIVDDLLATGGTAKAVCAMVEELGGDVAGLHFLIELDALKGRDVLKDYDVQAVLHY
ncbi:adenine phosphoribosyltransferase [Peptoniphilus equinus]|uniref:Adenine phosphoribosyltransferase n=1 Tax=Peptoniphilus equinus TaxID=3016343 RepID=A0ABY7QTE7_9FIRM|nr:adenine phosphoribosyltransferase [Peptoniphilus equinus]WBW49736.1 adenine phosphoribosyltransferase [Peptoniphilus equinus]